MPFHKKYPALIILFCLLIISLLTSGYNAIDQPKKQVLSSKMKSDLRTAKDTIVLADGDWDSINLHNQIAKFIIENGYGYPVELSSGKKDLLAIALAKNDIDIYMEYWASDYWISNYRISEYISKLYTKSMQSGNMLEVSVNFYDESREGLYVPTYMIKGDPARGIPALTPNLKTVFDLPQYAGLFPDPRHPEKGLITGAVKGWTAEQKLLEKKLKGYGAENSFNLLEFDSNQAMENTIIEALEAGKPWVGYGWSPTYITGKYDLTLLEEPPYNENTWKNTGLCDLPSIKVAVIVNKNLKKTAPDLVDFLRHYKTSVDITNQALVDMRDHHLTAEEEAKKFLRENPTLWTSWVPAEVAGKVKAALKSR